MSKPKDIYACVLESSGDMVMVWEDNVMEGPNPGKAPLVSHGTDKLHKFAKESSKSFGKTIVGRFEFKETIDPLSAD